MSTLSGKVAVVTGAGHPRGIGRSIALKLSQQGTTVVLTDICDESELERAAAAISSETGSQCLSVVCDISDTETVQDCVDYITEQCGCLDILINNAGVTAGDTEFLQIEDAHWDLSYQVNIKGTVNFCRAAIPVMLQQKEGVIVNNSSLCGLGAIETIPANYTASKFAIIGLTKAIALEYAEKNIRCNAICPGVVNTALRKGAISRISEKMNISMEEAEKLEDDSIAMKRAAEPEEIGDVVAWLVSPAASYVTGVALPVAGGMPHGL